MSNQEVKFKDKKVFNLFLSKETKADLNWLSYATDISLNKLMTNAIDGYVAELLSVHPKVR
jgi:predicted HicB family RNase H-like nuclease